jgi:hypothetical protein
VLCGAEPRAPERTSARHRNLLRAIGNSMGQSGSQADRAPGRADGVGELKPRSLLSRVRTARDDLGLGRNISVRSNKSHE